MASFYDRQVKVEDLKKVITETELVALGQVDLIQHILDNANAPFKVIDRETGDFSIEVRGEDVMNCINNFVIENFETNDEGEYIMPVEIREELEDMQQHLVSDEFYIFRSF